MFKKLKPIIIEDSRLPAWLSNVAPINIWAISFAFFVFCRGKLNEATKRHEIVHFQQQLELLFVGQWILYGLFYFYQLAKLRNKKEAYRQNPFEREANDSEYIVDYLEHRKRFAWVKYLREANKKER